MTQAPQQAKPRRRIAPVPVTDDDAAAQTAAALPAPTLQAADEQPEDVVMRAPIPPVAPGRRIFVPLSKENYVINYKKLIFEHGVTLEDLKHPPGERNAHAQEEAHGAQDDLVSALAADRGAATVCSHCVRVRSCQCI